MATEATNTHENCQQQRPSYGGGPRTEQGRARSSRNSLRHGLAARDLFVPEEDCEEFDEMKSTLLGEIRPEGSLQMIAFNALLHAAWNRLRVERMEAEYLSLGPQALEDDGIRKSLELLHRYHARHERSYYRARKELETLQTAVAAGWLLPQEVGECLPPLADPIRFTFAKRTTDKGWPPEEMITIQRIQPDSAPTQNGGFAGSGTPEANTRR
jgi:hypothetical protein